MTKGTKPVADEPWLEKKAKWHGNRGALHYQVFRKLMEGFLMPSFSDRIKKSMMVFIPSNVGWTSRFRWWNVWAESMKKSGMYSSPLRMAKEVVRVAGGPQWRKRQGWKDVLRLLSFSVDKMGKFPERRAFARWIKGELKAARM